MIEHLSLADLRALAHDCLTRAGSSAAVADAVACEVAVAEASGERGHGMAALLRDLRLIRYGRIEVNAPTRQSHPRPGLLHCDAGHGFAAFALSGVVARLCQTAHQQGIALLRLDRASDPGAMIHFTGELARGGLVTLAFAGSGSGRLAHPDHPLPMVLPHPDRSLLAAFLPPQGSGQPADSPLDGPVAHTALVLALDPAAGGGLLDTALRAALPLPEPAQKIALPTDLIEQIVTA
jgi:hypothetical protein